MDGAATAPAPTTAPQPDWVPRRRLDVRDYHRMAEAGILRAEDRVELIEGELIAMSPVGGPHMVRAMTLTHLLVRAVGDRAVVSVQNPIRLGDLSEAQPDLALLRPPAARFAGGPPTPADVLLLIEVADSTLRYDSAVKAALYARHGVGEYWVLDVEGGGVIVHRDPRAEGYASVRRAGPGDALEIAAVPGLGLPVAAVLG
jgi:hypothetical protein